MRTRTPPPPPRARNPARQTREWHPDRGAERVQCGTMRDVSLTGSGHRGEAPLERVESPADVARLLDTLHRMRIPNLIAIGALRRGTGAA